MVKKLLVLFSITVFFSCEKDIKVSFPYSGDQLVIFAELRQGMPVEAQISRTYNPNLSIDFNKEISDLVVLLIKDKVVFDTLRYLKKNIYLGKKKVTTGASYFIKILNKQIEPIESESIQLIEPNFSVNYKSIGKVTSKLNPSIKTNRFEIKVSGKTDNLFYYRVNINIQNTNSYLTKNPVNFNESIASDCYNFLTDLAYIRKKNCPIDSFKIAYDVELNYYSREKQMSIEPDSLIIQIDKFNENYYQYLIGISDNNFLENAFKTPILFKSNFTNASGVFYPIQSKSIILYKGKDY